MNCHCSKSEYSHIAFIIVAVGESRVAAGCCNKIHSSVFNPLQYFTVDSAFTLVRHYTKVSCIISYHRHGLVIKICYHDTSKLSIFYGNILFQV